MVRNCAVLTVDQYLKSTQTSTFLTDKLLAICLFTKTRLFLLVHDSFSIPKRGKREWLKYPRFMETHLSLTLVGEAEGVYF